MDKRKWQAIVDLLPEHAFVKNRDSFEPKHVDATWTTVSGVAAISTCDWSSSESWETHVLVENRTTGENVVLKTTDPARIQQALMLVGAL